MGLECNHSERSRERYRGSWARMELAIVALLIAGCATVIAPQDPQIVAQRLPFIRDGKTSKEEVLNRMGEPINRYENGRILTYTMCEDLYLKDRLRLSGTQPKSGKYDGPRTLILCDFTGDRYNLILVFGPDDLVERHSLVLVK